MADRQTSISAYSYLDFESQAKKKNIYVCVSGFPALPRFLPWP